MSQRFIKNATKKSVRPFIPKSKPQKGSRLQAVVFVPTTKNKWTIPKSMTWLREHDLNTIKPVDMVKKNGKISQLRFRIKDPRSFKRFITKKNKKLNIDFVIGFI